jgi:hypothetical protein
MDYKFLNESDKEIFEFTAGDNKDKFIHRRQGLISQLKDFRKKQASKHMWRANRWKTLVGIKRFHRSTQGKKFHRMLGRFLANRYTRDKEKRDSEYRENYDLSIALSSLQTHATLELGYFIPSILETVEYQEFVDYITEELGHIYTAITEGTLNFEEHEEFLLRLVETAELVKAFAEKTGKSVQEVESAWDKAKSIAKQQGKKEDEDGFYAYVVGILKRSLKIE